MEILKTMVLCLIVALAGCAKLTKNYTSPEESDAQKLIVFAQQFSLLESDKKRTTCKRLSQRKGIKNDPLISVKHAYIVAIYPPCGSLDVAITNLDKAKNKTLDHELELFLDYHLAVLHRIKKDRSVLNQYKSQLKAAQTKLDEIKSIEKTLNNRGN